MTLILILWGIMGILFQMLLPPIYLGVDLHPPVVTLAVIFTALYMGLARALVLSGVLGVTMDLLSPSFPGISIISLALLAILVFSQRKIVHYGQLPAGMLMTLIGVFFYLIVDYLLFSAQLNRWRWPFALWNQMVFNSVICALIAPLFYWFCHWIIRHYFRQVTTWEEYAD
jgi:cell shape-determining protein MreD